VPKNRISIKIKYCGTYCPLATEYLSDTQEFKSH